MWGASQPEEMWKRLQAARVEIVLSWIGPGLPEDPFPLRQASSILARARLRMF